jgi:DNA helicase-2/ATP-dependent DNA helicase PcrA
MLNKNQNIATEHINGPMMVLAGPGSGKTTVITARATRLVQEVQHLLVITYSKAAATEMERRFREKSPLAKNITFGTFHSVFFRMLRRKNSHNLEQILAEGERKNVVRSFLAEKNYDIEDDFLSTVLNEMSLIRNELHDLQYYHSSTMGADDFRELCRAYASYKSERNKIDFDDML